MRIQSKNKSKNKSENEFRSEFENKPKNKSRFLNLARNRSGQGLTEYVTLLVLVSLAAVGITQSLGKSVKNTIRKARDRIDSEIVFKEKR